MEWKPYLNDRLIAEHPDGFMVIKPKDPSIECRPIFCPLCEHVMCTLYDDESYKKFSVCDSCSAKWVYPDIERWRSGWRPKPEDVNKA